MDSTGSTIRGIVSDVLPRSVRRFLRYSAEQMANFPGQSSPRGYLDRLTQPGTDTPIAQYLDQLAVQRVRRALTKRTKDAQIVRWLGRMVWQYPFDAWILQEVVGDLKPDLIVETGTYL